MVYKKPLPKYSKEQLLQILLDPNLDRNYVYNLDLLERSQVLYLVSILLSYPVNVNNNFANEVFWITKRPYCVSFMMMVTWK